MGSRSALVVVALVFNWPTVRQRQVPGGVGRSRYSICSPLGRPAADLVFVFKKSAAFLDVKPAKLLYPNYMALKGIQDKIGYFRIGPLHYGTLTICY